MLNGFIGRLKTVFINIRLIFRVPKFARVFEHVRNGM